MLVVQLLLPRFLVVEVVFFIHFLQSSQACPSSKINAKRDAKNLKMTCQVPIGRNQIREEPLFYNIDGQYLLPNRQNGSNFITIEDKATISCPSAKFSSLGNGKKDVMEILCSKDNKFKTSQEETSLHEFTDLSCSKSIIESIKETVDKCGPQSGNGRITYIGWQLRGFEFRPQITICHDRQIDHTYFASHEIIGSKLTARSTGQRRPRFQESGFFTDISANDAYKKANQRVKILPNCHNCTYVNRGHLAPRTDFLYEEWQDATFNYINAVPQFADFNSRNWLAMEDAVRALAEKLNARFQVQTGTFGIAKGDNGQQLSLGSSNQMPVPLYLWKLVYDAKQNRAIVFVSVNHYVQFFKPGTSEIQQVLCPQDPNSFCEDSQWNFRHRKKIAKGILYCCTYQSFLQKVPWIKQYDSNPNVLINNN